MDIAKLSLTAIKHWHLALLATLGFKVRARSWVENPYSFVINDLQWRRADNVLPHQRHSSLDVTLAHVMH